MKHYLNFCCDKSILRIYDVHHDLQPDEENPAIHFTGAAFGSVKCLSCNKTFHFLLPNGLVVLDDEKYAKITM